jgi:hypothetical protein
MSKARVVTVTSGAAGAVRRGHPWIWRAGLARANDGLAMGEVVEVRASDGVPLGQGIWDDTSPIAVRLYARAVSPRLDAGAIAGGVERAIARRASLAASSETTAYRLCHGEDRCPVSSSIATTPWPSFVSTAAIATWLPDLAPRWRLLEPLGLVSPTAPIEG